MTYKAFAMAALTAFSISTKAQWTDHYSFNSSEFVATTTNKAVAGGTIGLFSYDTNEKALEKITKTNLLSSVDISALSDDGKSTLYVGYSDGNIDIVDVDNYSTINIPELKMSTSYDNKVINGFCKDGSTLYVATACGVLEVNLQHSEIKSQYKVVSETANVNAVAVANDTIYAATTAGLWKASTQSRILEAVSEWTLVGDASLSYCDMIEFNGEILVAAGTVGSSNTIYKVDGDTLSQVMTQARFRSFDVEGSSLLIAETNGIAVYDSNFQKTFGLSSYSELGTNNISFSLRAAKFFDSKTFAVANNGTGLILVDRDGNAQTYLPNGPINNYTFDLLSTSTTTYCTGGGFSSYAANYFRPVYLHCYNNSTWTTDTDNSGYDAIFLANDKNSPDSVYFASFGAGLYKVDGTKIAHHYYSDNSPLIDIYGGYRYTWVKSVAYDNNSNLFVANNHVSPGAYIISRDGEWYSLSYDIIDNIHSTSRTIVTSNDNIWIIIPRDDYEGLYIINTNGTPYDASDDLFRCVNYSGNDSRYFGTSAVVDEDGEQITTSANLINIVKEDRNGQIWLGTDNGVAVFNNDKTLFSSSAAPVFARIKVPRNDGTNNADYLLDGINVTALAIDGANRKWLGTTANGVFLVSADGLTTIENFTTDNSPLPTNEIYSISVSPSTGEVFFATPLGLVSYISDASEPASKIDDLKIYPNPVPPTYVSDVRITGLTDQAQVKITDIRGRLVSMTTSNGGMATWNCKNLEGHRVATGTYLVWAIDADGEESAVGKVVVIK